MVTEPTVVARHRRRGYSAAGMAAAELAREPEMEMVRPLAAGGIADRNALGALLHQVVNRVAGRQRIFRPDLVMAICPAMGGDDRLTILEMCARIGTRTAYLIDSPIAAAMGAGPPRAATAATWWPTSAPEPSMWPASPPRAPSPGGR